MNLFTFDQPEGAYDNRAYTRIDLNRAIVGNRWIERTWSAFFGTTSSVIQKAGDVEWAAPQNLEFMFQVDGEPRDPGTLDEITISEDASDMGATVRIQKSKAGIDAVYSTTALHEYPVLLRTFGIANTGSESVTLSEVCTEHIGWDSSSVQVWSRQFSVQEVGNWRGSGDDALLSIQLGDKGVILGSMDDATLHYEFDELPTCRITVDEDITLAPLQTWRAPSSYLIVFEGDPYDAHTQYYTALINELRLQQKRAEEIERLLAEEDG